MNLFVNSPAYYTKINGVVDDIYQFCMVISRNIDIALYTNSLDTIGITPIIVPANMLGGGEWKEVKQISLPYRMANISLHADYNSYHSGNISIKKQIIVDNILESLMVIKHKLKKDFDYERIEKDIKFLTSSMQL